jgi:hypothetical protein
MFGLDVLDIKYFIIKYLHMAVDAVTREPCSAANSLLTNRENYREFRVF